MLPAASVCGLYFSHPQSRYFAVGKIGRDQVLDYQRRKGLELRAIERWLGPYLNYERPTTNLGTPFARMAPSRSAGVAIFAPAAKVEHAPLRRGHPEAQRGICFSRHRPTPVKLVRPRGPQPASVILSRSGGPHFPASRSSGRAATQRRISPSPWVPFCLSSWLPPETAR